MSTAFARNLTYLVLLWLAAGCGGRAMEPGSSPLEPQAATAVASEVPGKAFAIPTDFYGFNAQLMRGPAWKEPGFITRVKELRPALIRYPGGTVASYWDWKTGGIDASLPIRNSWRNIHDAVPATLEDLKFACDQTGARPLFVLNMMHRSLDDQMAMLAHAHDIGLPIRYVELDNELYLGDEIYVNRFASGSDYAREANEWIGAIKKQYSGVRIAVVGYASREGGVNSKKPNADRTQNWNREVLSVIRNADAMTFHVYGGSGLNFMGSMTGDDNDETKAAQLQQKFAEPRAIEFVLTAPMMRWATAQAYDYKILPAGMKAWITEYNLFEKEGVVAGTWAHGLYALLLTMQFMNDSRTGHICYHNLSTSAQFAAIFSGEDGFSKSVVQKTTTRFGLTASGYTLNLFSEAMEGATQAVPLVFQGAPVVSGARSKSYNAIQGWNFRRSNGTAAVVVNLSASPVQVDFTALQGKALKAHGLYAAPQTQVGASTDLIKYSVTGKMVPLPPYSATVIVSE